MNTHLIRFVKWLLDVMFYGGFGVTLRISMIFHYVGKYMESFQVHYISQCILYIGSGILCLLIVLELRKIFDTALVDHTFVMGNADSLKHIGKLSFFLAALSLARLPLAITPATAVVIIVFSIAGLLCSVLCQVFERAVRLEERNDLTIQGGRGTMGVVINLGVMTAKRKKGLKELVTEVDITMADLSILKNSKAKAVRFSTLEAICRALDYQLGDVLIYGPEKRDDPDI